MTWAKWTERERKGKEEGKKRLLGETKRRGRRGWGWIWGAYREKKIENVIISQV